MIFINIIALCCCAVNLLYICNVPMKPILNLCNIFKCKSPD